jgi:zinc protease
MTDRKDIPKVKSEISFKLLKQNEFSLDNGLRVVFILKDKLPLVRLNLIVNAGSKYDPENKKGLSYLTSLVMDEGADGMNALQLSDEFDMLGSNFNLSADNDLINMSLQSLTENFDRSLELFSKFYSNLLLMVKILIERKRSCLPESCKAKMNQNF